MRRLRDTLGGRAPLIAIMGAVAPAVAASALAGRWTSDQSTLATDDLPVIDLPTPSAGDGAAAGTPVPERPRRPFPPAPTVQPPPTRAPMPPPAPQPAPAPPPAPAPAPAPVAPAPPDDDVRRDDNPAAVDTDDTDDDDDDDDETSADDDSSG